MAEVYLHDAARNGDVEAINKAVAAGQDVNARDAHKRTPLHLAAHAGQVRRRSRFFAPAPSLLSRSRRGPVPSPPVLADLSLPPSPSSPRPPQMDAAKFLVASGAKLHLEATDGVNALHFACMRGHHDLARELVNLGANAKAVTYKGENALHFAARTGDVKLISMLLRKQVSALTRSKRGKRPREVAKGEDAIAALRCVLLALVPVRPRSRGARRSLRTLLPGVCFSPPTTTRFQSPPSAPFNSTSDAFRLRPDSAAEAKAEEAARRTAEGLRAKGGETTSDGDGEGDGEEGWDVGEIGPAIGPAIGPPGRPMPPPEEEEEDDDAAAPSIGPSIGPSMPPPRHLREKREIAEVEDAPADALAAAVAAPVSKKAKKANGKPVLSFGDDDP
jgi:hypothetical protein